jgi:Carboxypeptidase regulatory-like domain
MTTYVYRWIILCVLFLICTGWVMASPTGSITGFVKDSSGALVPGVKVTVTNTGTNAQLTALSDENGGFQFPQLAPASYSLVFELSGFKKTLVNALVQVDQITRVDVVLEVGEIVQEVEVRAVGTLLESDKTTLSNVVESRTIANMPLNARQFLDLALITPGVLPSSAGTQGGGFNVSGARSQSNTFLLDGVSNVDTQINSALGNFRITDAVQEFAVQTSVPTAEFGRGTGGQISIVTKSGSNQFHGSVFEFFRNDALDAADFFTNKSNAKKNPLHRNQYGATLGGPVVKNKTFFFASWEGFRQVAPTVSSTRVPTDADRATVTDPISKSLLQFWPAPNAQRPGQINNFIWNVRATTFDNTYLGRVDQNFSDKDHLSFRWTDYRGTTFTPGDLPSLSGNANTPVSRSAVLNETHIISPTLLNEFRLGFSRNETFITVQDMGFDASTIFVGTDGKPLPGVVVASQNMLDSGLPAITVSGGFPRLGSTSNLPQGRTTNTYELFDNMSWVSPLGASRHSWRWGYHLRREDAKRFLDGDARGTFNFSTFAEFAAGLVNTSTFRYGGTMRYWRRYPWDLFWQDQYKIKDNLTLNYGIRYEYPSAIGQTRQNATNFIPGVGPVLLGTNQLLQIDPNKRGIASLVLTQAPLTLSKTGVNSDKNNFAPVLGMAYTPRFAQSLFGHDDTVIRLGFRVGYDDLFNNIPANMGLNAPYTLTTDQRAGVTQLGKFAWAIGYDQNVPLVSNFGRQGPGTPTSGLVTISAEDPNIRSAYVYQYNFGIQRRIRRDLSVEVDYQGSTGHKLGTFIDQNQPQVIVRDPTLRGNQSPNEQVFTYPFLGRVNTGVDLGNSNYNGVVFTTKYQGRQGIFIQGSYTLSKSIDSASAFFGSTGERQGVADVNNMKAERGPSSFDIRHRSVITFVIDVPVGPGHRLFGWNNGVNKQVFGGWQISGTTTLQTGAPFTVFNNSQDFSGFNQLNDRPDVVGTGRLQQNNRNVDAAFDKTYFSATPPTGRVGTSGRNQYYGPGLQNYNFAAAKSFKFTEQFGLQFRSEFFNLFNHTNFANPQNNQSNGNFGKITATVASATATAVGTTAGVAGGGPRVIQFSLRLQF